MSVHKKQKLNLSETDEYNKTVAHITPTYLQPSNNHTSDSLIRIEVSLVSKLKNVTFEKPVDCIYNPLEYAFETHTQFVHKYCGGTKRILFLGLNPGPWGMAQTGVPFGEVNITRDWLQIAGRVDKPENELPERRVTGFECHRSEISGKKFWNLFKQLCGTPDAFFRHAYMHNYCPLLLMKSTGSNVTPADLKNSTSAKQLLRFCDESLKEVITLLQVDTVIGIGRFAQKRADETVKAYGLRNVRVYFLLHPSPRIPKNEDWHEKATKTLTDLNLLHYFTK